MGESADGWNSDYTDGVVELSFVLFELGLQLVDRFPLGVPGLLLVLAQLAQFLHASLLPANRLLRLGVTPLLRLQFTLQFAHLPDTIVCTLFHRRTRASYVYNGCLAWYNVVLTHESTQA